MTRDERVQAVIGRLQAVEARAVMAQRMPLLRKHMNEDQITREARAMESLAREAIELLTTS